MWEEINRKIVDLASASSTMGHWRHLGEKIVWTNGCFDILHFGHIRYLIQAREFGDRLIVGLNSDASVRKIKGPSRPVMDERSRALKLASFIFIDLVIIFGQETPLNAIELLTPDILVKGGDYLSDEVVGSDWVRSHGGRVEIIPLVGGYSTSAIIDRIKKLHED